MENIFVEFLPPWVETGLQPAFYDKESGTVLQQTARMYDRVNMLVRMFNKLSKQTKETVENYIDQFDNLYNYVHDYFDNLDVQEEINNKLDQMAEDGDLEDIIRLYINKKVQYIFPKFWANQKSQDCSLIKGYDKNICIDCGCSTNWTNIQAMFLDNGITHFDYFILSHYHDDHMGNINNMISNGYIDSNTIVYLPIVPDRFPTYQTLETQVKSTLTANSIQFSTPSEGEKLEINDDFDIKFGNLTKSYMEDNYDNYNYTSMVCLVRHKDNYSFYAGDAGNPTYIFLYNNNFVDTTVDLYKQGHHGIDVTNSNGYRLQNAIKPINTVQCSGSADYEIGSFLCEETAFLVKGGTNYFPCCIQNDYLKFTTNGYSMNCENGSCRNVSSQGISITLYVNVNASTLETQDGTQDHPFSSIQQALGMVHNFPQGLVTINLADGEYCLNNEWPTNHAKNKLSICQGKDTKIKIVGNVNDDSAVKIHLVDIKYSDVTLEHITINNDDGNGLNAISSNVFLYSCIIEPQSSTTFNGIYADFSYIYMRKCSIKNSVHAITAVNGSTVKLGEDMVFTGNTSYFQIVRSIFESVNIFDSFDTTTRVASTTLPMNAFSYIEVHYDTGAGAPAGLSGSTIIMPVTNALASLAGENGSDGGTLYNRQAVAKITDMTHIAIIRERQLTVGVDNAVSNTALTNQFSITGIRGIIYSD